MRKILSLVLVLSMVFASFGSAFAAPKDVEGTDYEDAVVRLMALDIISGYDNGEFQPEKTITRAEFAKIMVHAVGVGESAQYSQGETKFSDVPGNHWASGYINQASGMKIINGYGDGTFGPEDKVTYAQAVAMIVRALGYEPKAKYMGGYPNGYLAVAAEEDITKDVSFADTASATRGDVAKMVNESLDVNLMYQSTWGDNPEFKNDRDDKTLLKTKLNFYEIEGTVVNVPNTKSSLKDDEIEVAIEEGGSGNKTFKLLVGDIDYDALLGLEVTLWADDNDDDGEVVNLEIDTDEDNIKFDTIVEKDTNKDEVYLYVDDDSYDWADGATIYVNFEEEKADKLPEDVYGYFVFNDDDEVTYANLFDFTEGSGVKAGVVFDVNGDKYEYVDRDANDDDELDLSDYKDGVFVYNEKFEVIDTDALEVGSAIYGWEDSDELYLVVKNDKVTGELEKVKKDEIEVDGESYERHDSNGAVYSDDNFDEFEKYVAREDLENLTGEKVSVVLDLNNEIQLIYGDSEATSGDMYGIITYGDLGSKSEASIFIEVEEGKSDEPSYKFETRSEAKTIENTDLDDLEYFKKQDDNQFSFAAIKFELNSDGEIEDGAIIPELAYNGSSDLPTFVDEVEDHGYQIGDLSKGSDSKKITVDSGSKSNEYYISKDTVFMSALDDDGELDPSLLKYDNMYEDIYEDQAVFVFAEGKDADMVVFLDKEFEGEDEDTYYGVVLDAWSNSDDDMAEIDVFEEGTKDYVVDDKDKFGIGDVIEFKLNNSDEAVRVSKGDASSKTYTYKDDYIEGLESSLLLLASKAVIYEAEDPGDALETTVSRSDIDDYNTITYIKDEDDIIVVAVVDEEKEKSTGGSGDVSGVTAEEVNETIIVYEGNAYSINNTSLVYDRNKNFLGNGGEYIDNIKTSLMTLKSDIVVDDDNILKKITINESFVKDNSNVTIDSVKQDINEDATITVELKGLDDNSYKALDKDLFHIDTNDGNGKIIISEVEESTETPGNYTFTVKNNKAETRIITVTVDGTELEDKISFEAYDRNEEENQSVVNDARDELDYEDILGENDAKDNVKKDLHLVTGLSGEAYEGVEISWESSDEDRIANNGSVKRGDSDQEVMLTATFTKGSASAQKPFLVNVKDGTAPTIEEGEITRTNATTGTVKFTSNEAGKYYTGKVEAGGEEPAINTDGSGTACTADQEQTISLTGLESSKAYDVYVVVKDAAGNVSEAVKFEVPAE